MHDMVDKWHSLTFFILIINWRQCIEHVIMYRIIIKTCTVMYCNFFSLKLWTIKPWDTCQAHINTHKKKTANWQMYSRERKPQVNKSYGGVIKCDRFIWQTSAFLTVKLLWRDKPFACISESFAYIYKPLGSSRYHLKLKSRPHWHNVQKQSDNLASQLLLQYCWQNNKWDNKSL